MNSLFDILAIFYSLKKTFDEKILLLKFIYQEKMYIINTFNSSVVIEFVLFVILLKHSV